MSALHTQNSITIRRDINDVFRFIAVDFFANYPRWSPEVLELEQFGGGRMQTGVTGRQVRSDGGYRSEANFRVTRLLPQRELRFVSTSGPHFDVRYRFEPVPAGTRLTFDFRLDVTLLMLPFQRRIRQVVEQGGRRVVENLRTLLEAETGVPAAGGTTPGPGPG